MRKAFAICNKTRLCSSLFLFPQGQKEVCRHFINNQLRIWIVGIRHIRTRDAKYLPRQDSGKAHGPAAAKVDGDSLTHA